MRSHTIEPIVCPKCESDDINADNFLQVGWNDAWRGVVCNSCTYGWREIFVFDHWEETELEALKRSAEQSYRFRGHGLTEWEVINEHTSRLVCPICSAQVTVNANPLPNEIDIGGRAVALTCEEADTFQF